ncbi:MAG: class I SAM-dependent methyltransferase [Bdellovibrionales bacterium]|nr:class I SAM-dependent methyltransferase [Bdellovibrionales bacterium]
MKLTEFSEIWGVVGPQQNRTKCPEYRAYNAYKSLKIAIEKGIEGDVVELGVWKGGISALFGRLCEDEGKGRVAWAFDSFQGMSECNEHDMAEGEDAVRLAREPGVQLHNFDLNDFNHTCFDLMKLKTSCVRAVPGWVNDTLPRYAPQIKAISVLRVDLDWHEPTLDAFNYLYDKVSPGGYVICDDFGYWKGARKAILDFRNARGIEDPIIQTPNIDGSPLPDIKVGTEHYWIKS